MINEENMSNEIITIVRKAKKSKYSIISNSIMQDITLSWKAKGILCYLLHLPDDWKINLVHLEKQATDGIDSLKSGFKELKEKGYIEHGTLRKKGRIIGHLWIVHEDPIITSEKPSHNECEPEVEKPAGGFTTSGKSATTNTKDSESKDSESKPNTKTSSSSLASPSKKIDDDDSGKYSSESVNYITPKGVAKTITSTEIYRHFIKAPYKTETIQKAIAKFQSITTPISDPFAYLDSVCKSLETKNELPKKEKSFKNTPRIQELPPENTRPLKKGIFL